MTRSRLAALTLSALCACQSTVDPQTPRKYRCNRDMNGVLSSECPGSWRCGKEGFCHDPGEKFPFQCDGQDDCAPTWHCGVAGLCYDRNTATDVQCRGNVPDDCAPGWRCGLNDHCHDQDAGSDYLCVSDTDCEKDWRCDLVGSTCIDSSTEALHDAGTLSPARVSPPLFGLPDLFSISDEYTDPLAGPDDCGNFRQLAALKGAVLSSIFETRCVNANIQPLSLRDDVTLPVTAARGLIALERKTFVLDATSIVRYDHDAQVATSLGTVATDAQRIAATPRDFSSDVPTYSPLLFVTGRDDYGIVDIDTDNLITPLTVPLPGGGTTGILDIAEMSSGDDTSPQVLAMISTAGLFITNRDPDWLGNVVDGGDPGWVPLLSPVLGNAACGIGLAQPPLRFVVSGNNVVVLQEPAPGAASGLVSFQTLNSSTSFGGDGYDACDAGSFTYFSGPCPACPDGETVGDIEVGDVYHPAFTRCQRPDGGSHLQYIDFDTTTGTCAFEEVDFYSESDSHFGAAGLQSRAVYSPYGTEQSLDEQGRWFTPSFDMASSLPTSAPLRMAGGGDVPLFTSTFYTDVDQQFEYSTAWHLGDAGFVEHEFDPDLTSLQFCNGVEGAPSLIVHTLMPTMLNVDGTAYVPVDPNAAPLIAVSPLDQVLSVYRPNENIDVHPIAKLASTQGLPAVLCWPDAEPTVHATVAKTADAHTALIVAVQDSMWAGLWVDAGTLPDGGARPPEQLQPQLTPVPRGRITSLAATDPDLTHGEYVSGYVLAQHRLFHIYAIDSNQWGEQEVQLPAGAPLGVWADGPSARVAFASGRVLSLPSRSELITGGILPNGALAIAGFCKQGYAMTPDGLYRLEPDPMNAKAATWVSVPLGITTPSASTGAFVDGAMYATPSTLYVFNRFGTAVAVHDATCP